ncbi:uncharacterized protein C9orf50 homolog isoform X1 [Equus asinus]|uniref:uncharacterized protein C9orf50 homolog isoform X1 n=1 Tax=Equus asinus TaxID=9793 RepID=UPI0038F6225F
MPRRHPKPGAQWVAPKGFPDEGDGASRRRPPLLPRLPPPELRASWGADGLGGSRASGGGAGWWQTPRGQASPAAPGEGVRSPPPRLPALPTVAPRAARDRTGLRSLLLPPLLLARAARAPAPPRPEPRECEDPRRGPAKEAADSLGALLGEFLPSRFREFLRQLGVERAEQPRPRTSSAAQHQRSVSERSQRCPCCPRASFLPDLQGKSSFIRNSLKKILLHQIPALGTSKRDHSQFTTIKKASHSSEEGSGHCRRCSPFRVRFADETLRDTALRYWERSCAVQQGSLKNGTATRSLASERAFGSLGRWLENLPKDLYSSAKAEAVAGSPFSWNYPCRCTQEPQGHLSEDASMKSRLPVIPRATTQRQQGDLKTFPDTHRILEQVGKSPCSWSQKLESFPPSLVLHTVLKQDCPKGYQLLLPSATSQQAQW